MNLKQEAARQALELVRSGMTVGLGSGSTSAEFVELLGKRAQSGALNGLRCVSTSEKTAQRARELGLQLVSLADCGQPPKLDLAVDGADEVDPQLNLIKGLGWALLREKIIEIHAERLVIIVDESKLVSRLGEHVPLPVELVTFEADVHLRWLGSLGCQAEYYRKPDGSMIVTDNGNYLALCRFEGGISDPFALARSLADRPGIVEHGLFLNMADQVIAAGADGIRTFERPPAGR
jgi:ribose 5-phosphate isomerase A